jgi:hypothetical protein
MNHSGVQQLAHQVEQLGGTPVVQPSSLPGSKGVPGARGAAGPGPTAAQVADAVAIYCAGHNACVGGPTSAQVAVAVRGYCAAGQCRGPAGEGATGSAGKNGADGPVGQQGPAPTDDQITAAVASYCQAHDDCVGPTGPTGPSGSSGKDGSDGRGISSVECTALVPAQQLVIHYTDGSTQTVTCALPGN